jgi:hypothetical protein
MDSTGEHSIPVYNVEDPKSTIRWWPQDCVYWLPQQVMENLFAGITNRLNDGLKYDMQRHGIQGTPWSLNLYKNGTATLDTVQVIMDGMARSITARLRQGDGVSINAGPAYGKVREMQTCVRVNWGYLGLPVGLLLLTLAFLFLTIVKTRSREAHVWKSSIHICGTIQWA